MKILADQQFLTPEQHDIKSYAEFKALAEIFFILFFLFLFFQEASCHLFGKGHQKWLQKDFKMAVNMKRRTVLQTTTQNGSIYFVALSCKSNQINHLIGLNLHLVRFGLILSTNVHRVAGVATV